jgi:small-conductance mechanosensitive channel
MTALSRFRAFILNICILVPTVYVWRFQFVPQHAPAREILLDAVWFLLLFSALNIVFISLEIIIVFVYRKRRSFSSDYMDNFIIGIHKVSKVFVWFVVVLMFVHGAVIDIRELFTSFAIVAGFVGIVFKEYILNIVNGLFIMFTGKFRMREFVKIGEYKGRITNLSFHYMELLTDTKDVVYVPNHIIFSREIVNYSRNAIKNVFVEFVIAKTQYDLFEELCRRIVARAMEDYGHMIGGEENIKMNMTELRESSVLWTAEFITTQYNFLLERGLRNIVASSVMDVLGGDAHAVSEEKS